MATPDNFLGIDKPFSVYQQARAAVLPVPYEATTSYGKGTRRGPSAIIRASQTVEFYDDELDCDAFRSFGITTLKPLAFGKKRGVPAMSMIERAVARLIQDDKFPVCFGGEHTITSPIVRAFHRRWGDSLSVLQIDAHSDLRDTYEGTPWSHACVMRRIWEFNRNIVQVGIRAQCAEERAFIVENGIRTFYAADLVADAGWMDRVIRSLKGRVYVTIDCDGLDPSIIPATGTPEPGGLGWYETLQFLRRVFAEREVVGFDIVELAPIRGMLHSDFTLAKLAYKLMGYRFVTP